MDKELEKELQRHSDWVRGYRSKEAEVVKCKECKRKYLKAMNYYCNERVHPLVPDGFCERGER